MALAGGGFETVPRRTVHQPMLTCSSLKCGQSSSWESQHFEVQSIPESKPYPASMLVRLKCEVKHFACLFAFLIHQLVADRQEARETSLDNLVKVLPVLAISGLVSESPAESQEALKTGKHGVWVVCV